MLDAFENKYGGQWGAVREKTEEEEDNWISQNIS